MVLLSQTRSIKVSAELVPPLVILTLKNKSWLISCICGKTVHDIPENLFL